MPLNQRQNLEAILKTKSYVTPEDAKAKDMFVEDYMELNCRALPC